MKKKALLVTGGAGFIGSHTVEWLSREEDLPVVVVDNLSTGKSDNIKDFPNTVLYEENIADGVFLKKLFSEYDFSYIYHLAAEASVVRSIEDPVETHSINQFSTIKLLELARGCSSLKQFVFASSAAVYGNNPSLPCRETDAVDPISPYGIDKYGSERFTSVFFSLYGVPATAFRFFNVYGPRQNPGSPYSGVLSIFTDQFKAQAQPRIKVFGDGEQTRDFIYISDLISAFKTAKQSPEHFNGQVHNLARGERVSLLNIIQSLEEITGKKADVQFEEERKGDIKHSLADIDKLKERGYSPGINIQEGLKIYMDYLENSK